MGIEHLGIQGTFTLTSPQQELLWLRFDRGGRTPELSGCAKEYRHMQETIKGLDYFLKEIMFSKHTAQSNLSAESQMSQWLQLQDSVSLYLQ